MKHATKHIMKDSCRPMRPYAAERVRITREGGFALVSAIFLLIVLSGLGIAIVTFSTTQQATSAYDLLGSRAYQAARTGVEWALYQRLNPQVSAPNTSPAYCQSSGASVTTNLTLPAGTTLSGFTVTVTCTSVTSTNLPVPVTIRSIQAVSCNQPTSGACPNPTPRLDYVQRVEQASIQEKF